MKPQLLLVGAGGHAVSCIDVIEQEEHYSVVGIVGIMNEIGSHVGRYPVIGCDSDLDKLRQITGFALVTLGQIKTPNARKYMFETLSQIGYQMPTIVSPHAYVSPHAFLGEGTIVMHGAVVNAGVVIGRNCILNSNCLIEHGVSIEDHVHVSTACVINGDVRVGAGTFLGSASCIRQSLSIGENCVIGMGEKIFSDCANGQWVSHKGVVCEEH